MVGLLALLVVAALAWFIFFRGGGGGTEHKVDVNVNVPGAPRAAAARAGRVDQADPAAGRIPEPRSSGNADRAPDFSVARSASSFTIFDARGGAFVACSRLARRCDARLRITIYRPSILILR